VIPVITPWGESDDKKKYADGIVWYDTPTHGGFWISEKRLAEMPSGARSFRPWAGTGWYEEDCDWVIAVLAFPEHFPKEEVAQAKVSFLRNEEYFKKNGMTAMMTAMVTAMVV
jgi:hypothetical protein